VPSFQAFAEATRCVLVVTQPDRPAGRGLKLRQAPVKAAAHALGIPAIQPERIRDALAALGDTGAELFAIASYGKIVPQAVLDIPRYGALNVHPSLLPLYRGATPLQSQLRDGVTESGVTVILMDAGMDTGDIVRQEKSAIGARETYGELHDRFAVLGARLLAACCADVREGRPLERRPQAGLANEDEIARTLTRPLRKEDLAIDWRWPAARVVDHVRSLAPVPGARAHLDGEAEVVKILEVRVATAQECDVPTVRCGDGEYVAIERLVPPNRKALTGHDYLLSARAAASRAR